MAGPNPPKSSSSSSSAAAIAASSHSYRKSRWESSSNAGKNQSTDAKSTTKPNPSPKPGPSPSQAQNKSQSDAKPTPPSGSGLNFPDPATLLGPPPPPSYGFHMLERRTIILYDGSVRSYFALPPEYQDFPSRPFDLGHRLHGPPDFSSPPLGFRDNRDFRNPSGLDGPGSIKRKYEEERDPRDAKKEELGRQRFTQYTNPNGYPLGPGRPDFIAGTSGPFINEEMRPAKYMRGDGGYEHAGGFNKQLNVDQTALKKAFLFFSKVIYENPMQKKNYLEDGKHDRLQCVACGRSSKDFSDMHALIMHTYNSDNAALRVDHLGLHKALCVLMGWNFSKPPDNLKAYKFLPADEAAANQEDLILWPPVVIIHNTITGKGKDGRMEGLGNKAMDNKIRGIMCPFFFIGINDLHISWHLLLETFSISLYVPHRL
ncbi:hypothetical protein SLEP1_g50112 [Rubroshorea leprosula]|uniref:XS domain-containing protein n=1 Tax=Rubroshorea leprosula TaxID=152421 RepID=A0AAV5LZ77_9ROSI|nr:hypothetical protein SLEP1_g50112 [Rubroshorea leprosula]